MRPMGAGGKFVECEAGESPLSVTFQYGAPVRDLLHPCAAMQASNFVLIADIFSSCVLPATAAIPDVLHAGRSAADRAPVRPWPLASGPPTTDVQAPSGITIANAVTRAALIAFLIRLCCFAVVANDPRSAKFCLPSTRLNPLDRVSSLTWPRTPPFDNA